MKYTLLYGRLKLAVVFVNTPLYVFQSIAVNLTGFWRRLRAARIFYLNDQHFSLLMDRYLNMRLLLNRDLTAFLDRIVDRIS